jgi:hypothetical protein
MNSSYQTNPAMETVGREESYGENVSPVNQDVGGYEDEEYQGGGYQGEEGYQELGGWQGGLRSGYGGGGYSDGLTPAQTQQIMAQTTANAQCNALQIESGGQAMVDLA